MRRAFTMVVLFVWFAYLGACSPANTSNQNSDAGGLNPHAAEPLTWEQASLGCSYINTGQSNKLVCNHGHSINFRSSNLYERLQFLRIKGRENVSIADLMTSDPDGKQGLNLPEPMTPVLRAIMGERIRIRLISYGPEAHNFHVHGHLWDQKGTPTDTRALSPADVYDAVEFYAGGGYEKSDERAGVGDWKYHCHFPMHVPSGMWGLMRVGTQASLQKDLDAQGRFPNEIPQAVGGPGQAVEFWVVAVQARLTVSRFVQGGEFAPTVRQARLYVPMPNKAAWDSATAESAAKIVEDKRDTWQPWTLVVRQGTKFRVHLKNLLPEGIPVSLHPHGVSYKIKHDGSTPIGIVWPGKSYAYDWVADRPGTWPMHDHARTIENLSRGLFAALVVKTPEEEQRIKRDYLLILHDYNLSWFLGFSQPLSAGGHGGH